MDNEHSKQPNKVVHANGDFEFKTTGLDRVNAHIQIFSHLDPNGSIYGAMDPKKEKDQEIAKIMASDPSLFLDRIPDHSPSPCNTNLADNSRIHADHIWMKYSKWYGNWLTRFLTPNSDFTHTIRIALESGIHPDDESVWPAKRLLGTVEWLTDPKRLATALSFGASPNRNSGDWKDSYLRTVLKVIQANIGGSRTAKNDSKIIDALDCAILLINAGATEFDAPKAIFAGAGKTHDFWEVQSALTFMLNTGGTPCGVEMKQKYREVIGCMQRAGVDLDARDGVEIRPPVIYALRSLNINVACELIRLGCNISDDFLLRPENSKGGVIKSILTEANEAGGEYFEIKIVEAIMERQIHVATKDSIRTPGPIAARRRIGV